MELGFGGKESFQGFSFTVKVLKSTIIPWAERMFALVSNRIFSLNQTIMAKNKPYGDGARKGAVKNRSQVLNPKTGLFVKRGSDGKFMDVKTSGGKFKGVRKEK